MATPRACGILVPNHGLNHGIVREVRVCFPYGHTVTLISFVVKAIFSPSNCLCSLVEKSIDHMQFQVVFSYRSVSIISYACAC